MAIHQITLPRSPRQPAGVIVPNWASQQARGLRFWAPLPPGPARFSELTTPLSGILDAGWAPSYRSRAAFTAIDFNGTTDRIDYNYTAYDPANTTTGCSMSCWAYFDVVSQVNPQYLINTQDATDAAIAVNMQLVGSGSAAGSIGMSIGRATAATFRFMSASTIPISTWVHVVATWAGGTAASGINLYKDGRLTSMAAGTNGVGAITPAVGTFNVGGRTFDDTRNLNGMMFDARIYDHVLTAAEVYALYDITTRGDLYGLPVRQIAFNEAEAATFLAWMQGDYPILPRRILLPDSPIVGPVPSTRGVTRFVEPIQVFTRQMPVDGGTVITPAGARGPRPGPDVPLILPRQPASPGLATAPPIVQDVTVPVPSQLTLVSGAPAPYVPIPSGEE